MNKENSNINKMNIWKRKDGRFEGRLTIRGKRKGFYGSTKAEVKSKAQKYLMVVQQDEYKLLGDIKLSEYAKYWLETYKKNKIQPSSYSRLCTVYYNQIEQSPLGGKKLCDISTKDIQSMVDEYANPTNQEHKALSLSGLKKIVNFLHPCLDKAVLEGCIPKNPCVNIEYPPQDCMIVQTKQQHSLTDEELASFKQTALSKYKNGKFKSRDWIVLLIMLNTGVRVGEILALEWNDIDFTNTTMHISKTMQSNIRDYTSCDKVSYYNRIRQTTKTKHGVRYIPLNEQCIQYLRILQEFDKENNIVSSYVACSLMGGYTTARNLQRSLDRLTRDAEISTHVSLHTLRHTFGSTLLRRHIEISVISQLMGHANISITYNKYIHVIQEEKSKAMNMVQVC